MTNTVVLETNVPGLKLRGRGKVRDIYEDGDRLLIVATDRISAFDYILATGIPDKGRVLTQMTLFWLDFLRDMVPNHFLSSDVPPGLEGRSMWVQRADMIRGRMRGARLPVRLRLEGLSAHRRGLRNSAARRPARKRPACPSRSSRPPPRRKAATTKIFLSSTAATSIGAEPAARLRDLTLAIYSAPRITPARAASSSPIRNSNSAWWTARSSLADEVLTPDSSRFWPLDRTSPAARSLPTTSNTCATIWNPSTGTSSLPRPRFRRTSRGAPAKNTRKPIAR